MAVVSAFIPSAEWPAFLHGFSQRHAQWLCTLERADSPTAPQAPLQWITANDSGEIELHLGREGDITVHKFQARALSRLEMADGRIAGLQWVDAGGEAVILRFRVPAQPEEVDGLPPKFETTQRR